MGKGRIRIVRDRYPVPPVLSGQRTVRCIVRSSPTPKNPRAKTIGRAKAIGNGTGVVPGLCRICRIRGAKTEREPGDEHPEMGFSFQKNCLPREVSRGNNSLYATGIGGAAMNS